MKKKNLKVGDIVEFTSGNFEGLTGKIKNIDWNSTHKNAIYGFYHEVLLSDGRTGFIEKSEHWEFYTKGYVILESERMRQKGIKCLTCERTSYNLNDIKNLYCGYCNKFHE